MRKEIRISVQRIIFRVIVFVILDCVVLRVFVSFSTNKTGTHRISIIERKKHDQAHERVRSVPGQSYARFVILLVPETVRKGWYLGTLASYQCGLPQQLSEFRFLPCPLPHARVAPVCTQTRLYTEPCSTLCFLLLVERLRGFS